MIDSSRNSRIVKNSLLLYIRTIFALLINLYTSRAILSILGVIDYGVYNVVGGVIVMLGFLTYSLSSSSSRFITFNLGIGDMNLMKKTFGNILSIQILMVIAIVIISETFGLWFVSTQLQIPTERQYAALWVYQCAILSSAVGLVSVPYNAAIIAHEKMSAFAYISIIDVTLKLGIVYLLLIIPYDRLITYSFLYLGIQLFNCFLQGIYCTHHFEDTKTRMAYDRKVFKEIFSFAGWTLGSNIAAMGFTQGLNMLLNIFFGPAVNAARGIAVQVQNACQQFCSNFQMALNPQLVKSYAQEDLEYMHKLLIKSSKFSFYILFIITMPLIFETEFVLKLWLGTVPDHTVAFVRLMLILSLLYTLSNPIVTSVQATGTIKKFKICESLLLLTIVPISYVLLKFFNAVPESVFIVHATIEGITLCVRLKIALPMIKMNKSTYLKTVISRISIVSTLSFIIPYIVYKHIPSGVFSFFIICLICLTCTALLIYTLGITNSERNFIRSKINIVKRKLFLSTKSLSEH